MLDQPYWFEGPPQGTLSTCPRRCGGKLSWSEPASLNSNRATSCMNLAARAAVIRPKAGEFQTGWPVFGSAITESDTSGACRLV